MRWARALVLGGLILPGAALGGSERIYGNAGGCALYADPVAAAQDGAVLVRDAQLRVQDQDCTILRIGRESGQIEKLIAGCGQDAAREIRVWRFRVHGAGGFVLSDPESEFRAVLAPCE